MQHHPSVPNSHRPQLPNPYLLAPNFVNRSDTIMLMTCCICTHAAARARTVGGSVSTRCRAKQRHDHPRRFRPLRQTPSAHPIAPPSEYPTDNYHNKHSVQPSCPILLAHYKTLQLMHTHKIAPNCVNPKQQQLAGDNFLPSNRSTLRGIESTPTQAIYPPSPKSKSKRGSQGSKKQLGSNCD